jgi:hypothetical protein
MAREVTYYEHPILRARDSSLCDDRSLEIQAIGPDKITKIPLIFKDTTLLSSMDWDPKDTKFLTDYFKSLLKRDDVETPTKVVTYPEMYFEILEEAKKIDIAFRNTQTEVAKLLGILTTQVENAMQNEIKSPRVQSEIKKRVTEKLGKSSEMLEQDEKQKVDRLISKLSRNVTKNLTQNLVTTIVGKDQDLEQETKLVLNELIDRVEDTLEPASHYVVLLGERVDSLLTFLGRSEQERLAELTVIITEGVNELLTMLDATDLKTEIKEE